MDLRATPEEEAFRLEVREFVASHLPDDIRRKVLGFLRVEREDYVRWQRILDARGWGAPGWPVAHGGCGWNAVQRNIFEEECFTAGAPRQRTGRSRRSEPRRASERQSIEGQVRPLLTPPRSLPQSYHSATRTPTSSRCRSRSAGSW